MKVVMELKRSIAPVIVVSIVIIILILTIKKKRKSNGKIEIYMSEGIALELCIGAELVHQCLTIYPILLVLKHLLDFCKECRLRNRHTHNE